MYGNWQVILISICLRFTIFSSNSNRAQLDFFNGLQCYVRGTESKVDTTGNDWLRIENFYDDIER